MNTSRVNMTLVCTPTDCLQTIASGGREKGRLVLHVSGKDFLLKFKQNPNLTGDFNSAWGKGTAGQID